MEKHKDKIRYAEMTSFLKKIDADIDKGLIKDVSDIEKYGRNNVGILERQPKKRTSEHFIDIVVFYKSNNEMIMSLSIDEYRIYKKLKLDILGVV